TVFELLEPRLASDAREERRHAVVILLAPFLERMVVAAGTLDPQAEEQLGGIFHLLVDHPHLLVPGDAGAFAHLARAGENLADELVVGLVVDERAANPAVEG